MSKEGVKVRILDRTFTIACPPGEQASVEAAAEHLNDQLENMQAQSKVIGLEHTVVLAALNIANELLASRRDGVTDDDALERVRELRQRVSVVTGQSDASHLIYSNKEQIQFTYLINDSIILDLIIAPQSSK